MIALRPHHGLCIRHFAGKGYSNEFVENMYNVIEQLNANNDVMIKLIAKPDVICKKCPHNNGDECSSGQKVLDYDNRCLELCPINDGDIIKWGEYQALVKENIIDKGLLKTVCKGCQWIYLCEK